MQPRYAAFTIPDKNIKITEPTVKLILAMHKYMHKQQNTSLKQIFKSFVKKLVLSMAEGFLMLGIRSRSQD